MVHAKRTILLVEDEESITTPLAEALERDGFHTEVAHTVADGLAKGRTVRPDLVLLDIGLPDGSGLDVCRELRSGSSVPIIILSARGEEADRVVGLELGADDYVTKPFELPELVARARAALRRASAVPEDPVITRGDLEIDPAAFVARKNSEEVNLTVTEFKLLLEIARRPGQVFTRELLLERVWNYEYLGDSRLVDVAVQRLRAKVEDDPKEPKHIKTVRGVGYRFDVE
jgi:two-component system response regulator MtrA